MADRRQELKEMIVQVLNMEDVTPADIGDDTPLFGEGLGLDSIDALELIVEVEKRYGVKIESRDVADEVLASVRTLADYIEGRRET